uniref:DDE Tnp4 domain-containing protein n=1 Tax=Anopheles atroparvus TaxID=41427 RepID=A0AAG5D146_ANOAO
LPQTHNGWTLQNNLNFPHAIGAIDGKHVSIRSPGHSGSDYYNYKGFYSIVLLVIVDAHYNFMFADAGGKGGISDGGIFRNSRLHYKLENKLLNIPRAEPLRIPYKIPVPYFFLGDKAFAFTDYCIRPFGGLHPPGSYQRVFNYRHSRARMPVENALGILANRFQVLKGPILLEPDVAKHIVLTTVYLHNFLRKSTSNNSYAPPSSFDRIVDGNLVQGDWRNNVPLQNMLSISARTPDRLMKIREHMFFLTKTLFFVL